MSKKGEAPKMGKKLQIKKMMELLSNLNDPAKLISSFLPLNGRFLIETFANFPYAETKWNLAIFFRELEDNEHPEQTENPSLGELLNSIPLGEIIVKVESLEWKQQEVIGIFIRKPQ